MRGANVMALLITVAVGLAFFARTHGPSATEIKLNRAVSVQEEQVSRLRAELQAEQHKVEQL